MAATTDATKPPEGNPLLEQLVQLTDAVRQLAERQVATAPDPDTAADRIRQRVAFGYQVLGTLTGRVSSNGRAEFDVPLVQATRLPHEVRFEGLPPGADWVELRAGTKVELLPIERDQRVDQAGARKPDRHRPDRGRVRPEEFADSQPIGSVVVLRDRQGPLTAFGPRPGPVSSARQHP